MIILIKIIINSRNKYETGTIEIFLTKKKKFVLTIRSKNVPQGPLNLIYNQLNQVQQHIELHSSWILYMLLDCAVDGFIPALESLSFEADSINQLVLILPQSEQSDMLTRIGNARKLHMELEDDISSKSDVFKKLFLEIAKPQNHLVLESTFIYLKHLANRCTGMEKNLRHVYNEINRAQYFYLAKISFEQTQSAYKVGISMNKFSCGMCILLPMGLIAGGMGLNVRVPFDLENPNVSNWPFALIMTIFAIIGITGIILGRRRGLL